MSVENLTQVTCAVCAKRTFKDDVSVVDPRQINLELLRNDKLPKHVLPRTYNFVAYKEALLHPNGLLLPQQRGPMRICLACMKDLNTDRMPKFALCNWLYYGRESLPIAVKRAFDEATLFEKTLISRVRTNTICVRFDAVRDEHIDGENTYRQGAKGMRGNVIMAPLNIPKLNSFLPPPPETIRDTFCVLVTGYNQKPSPETVKKYQPILARKSRVKTMIEFLLEWNPHYKAVGGFKGFSAEYLNGLMEGQEGFPESVEIAHMGNNATMAKATAGPVALQDMRDRAVARCLSGKGYIGIRKGQLPIPDFDNPFILSWTHPYIDPWGIGGFHHPERTRKISMQEQLRHMMLMDDPVIQSDLEFALVFYNVLQKKAVSETIRFNVPESKRSKITEEILNTDREVLLKLSEKYKNDPKYFPTSQSEKKVLRTLQSLGLLSRNVLGSAAQKLALRNQIRGIINNRGAPTLFLTLTPSDRDNFLVHVLAGSPYSVEDLLNGSHMPDKNKRTKFANEHPAACARFFDVIVRAFIWIILGYGQEQGLYGKCEAYFGVVEAQGRGTLHIHFLVWLAGHPSPEELRHRMASSQEYRDRLTEWLEFVMQSNYAGYEPRSNVANLTRQSERELVGNAGLPHPGTVLGPVFSTLQRKEFWEEYPGYLNRLLVEYNIHVHTPTCWKYLKRGEPHTDANCRLGMDGEMRAKTIIDTETGLINVKREHGRMAYFTALVMFLFKGNMDIRYILSGEDASSCMYYVTDYITKAPMTMHVGLSALSYAIQRVDEKRKAVEQSATDGNSKPSAISAVTTAVNCMTGRQELSQPQIMSYILGSGDHYTSEVFRSFNWGEMVRFVRLSTDQTGSGSDENLSVVLTLKPEGEISVSSQRLDYIHRPVEEEFEILCLYDFLAFTEKEQLRTPSKKRTAEQPGQSNVVDPESHRDRPEVRNLSVKQFSSVEHPQYESHGLRLRREGLVPVLLGPNLAHRETEKERWACDMLTLFKPWREPVELKPAPEASWYDNFRAFQPKLSARHLKVIENMATLAKSRESREFGSKFKRKGQSSGGALVDEELLADVLGDSEYVSNPNACVYGTVTAPSPDGNSSKAHGAKRRLQEQLTSQVVDDFERCYPEDDFMDVDPKENPEVQLADEESLERVQALVNTLAQEKAVQAAFSPIPTASVNGKKRSEPREFAPPDNCRLSVAMGRSKSDDRWKIAVDLIEERKLGDNTEQLRAFLVVAKHLIDGGEQLFLFINGMGGTGKSYVIKSIIMLFERLNRGSQLLVGAPTGIAAVLIGGHTLHSLILSGIGKNNSAKDKLIEKWRDVSWLIIDEISMVGASFFAELNARIKMGKGQDPASRDSPFGGVNVICLGDFCQLKPPRQVTLFSHTMLNPSQQEVDSSWGINSMTGAYLWKQFRTVISNVLKNRPAEVPLFWSAPVVVGIKVVRDSVNARLIEYHARRAGEHVYIYHSRDMMSRKEVPALWRNRLWDLPATETSDSLGRLPLFVGLRVMVTENVLLKQGIVNGAEGHVVGIGYRTSSEGVRHATVVYVKVDGSKIKLCEELGTGVIPMVPTPNRVKYDFPQSLGGAKGFTRYQIPIIPAYSYTDYKSQGRSLDKCIVDLNTARGQGVYVMLSRVKSLSGLLILRHFPEGTLFQRLSDELRRELARLAELEEQTREEWKVEELTLLCQDKD
ncbi:hypothetical protein CC1G_08120 [Coprinopsis cinerea okayama7|uniref:ATP-dependent DNA helicase n=1 Tax=Coprinopsis cinerea (strain Okayama-7 / 130 / ATCC MYA-4618 / FGSC 9003) TaxID=240176 RepID=A8NYZ7_COPC7|nr:hypothetical protein CC1G_08120 [Coprinopsis cinerea okayama7\|eukprot:XP_001837566.2 hypothetical protein CC1G_08120 [Coprinopsis cinerea okayama7\